MRFLSRTSPRTLDENPPPFAVTIKCHHTITHPGPSTSNGSSIPIHRFAGSSCASHRRRSRSDCGPELSRRQRRPGSPASRPPISLWQVGRPTRSSSDRVLTSTARNRWPAFMERFGLRLGGWRRVALRARWPQQLRSTTFPGAGPRPRCSGHGRRRGFFHPATIEIRRCVQK